MSKSLWGVVLLACAGCVTTPSPRIDDTSFSMGDGVRAIRLTAWLAAPPQDVYRAVSTAEGWKSWAVRAAFGDASVNGVMETSYNPAAQPGDAGNIKQQFLALVPDRLVVFRTIKTPDGFPNRDLYMQTVAIMDLQPEAGGTRFTFTHEGFGRSPGFDQLYDFFRQGDAETMASLQQRFATGQLAPIGE